MFITERMTEMKEILAPFLQLVENGTCPDCDAVTFVKTKYDLVLNYCVNISFYLMLKAKGLPAQSHPVIKRLEQYRQLLRQLQSKEKNLLKEVTEIVKAVKEGKPLYSVSDVSQKPIDGKTKKFDTFNKKLIHRKTMVMQDEQEELSSDSADMDSLGEDTHENNFNVNEKYDSKDKENEEVVKEEGKRAITYQIAKNRGLTPYRRKELRNPRVKHRNKYRKAKIRRRGAVCITRHEEKK